MNKNFILITLLISAVAYAQQSQERSCDQIAGGDEGALRRCYQERAQTQRNGGQNGGQNNDNGNLPYLDCRPVFETPRVPLAAASGITTPSPTSSVIYFTPANQAPAPTLITAPGEGYPVAVNDRLVKCRGFEGISSNLGNDSLRDTDSKVANDGKITCVKKSGLTADWESCTSALSMYNNIVLAEAAMQIFQGVQTNNVQNQAQRDVNQRAASGDAQNAAYDAQVKTVNSAKALNEQQAMTYAAAVAALYSKVQSWINETPEAVSQKGCGVATAPPAATVTTDAGPPKVYASQEAIPRPTRLDCVPYARAAVETYRGIVFANRTAKGKFTTAAMMFAAKAIKAGIKASQLGNIARQVEEAKKSTEDPYNPATFELCKATPMDPSCGTAGQRVPGSGIGDGGFSFGGDFGNNAFTPVATEDVLAPTSTLGDAGDSRVSDTSSPFADEAKTANGILDPAAAASIQPSGGAGGAGGAGGGGAPGGGSASLGNDTPGADDSKKENDIKANKADGKYNISGGGAFQAIRPMKEENPFSSLFDGKAGGSLEEDRSIASGDIDGRDSGIFSKISKRYSQVQADKRIEAKNLDE